MKTTGQYERMFDGWRIQLYWPELTLQSGEWFAALDTCFRIQTAGRSKGYRAFGFKILGIGIGLDRWDVERPSVTVGESR